MHVSKSKEQIPQETSKQGTTKMKEDNPILLIYTSSLKYDCVKGRSQVTHPQVPCSNAPLIHRTSLTKLSEAFDGSRD